MADLAALKHLSKVRESEEKKLAERRRNVLVLILRHLADFGYVEAYERLTTESNVSLNKVDVADNIDLLHVVQEFEESYEMKYGRRPKLVKRLVEEVQAGGGAVRQVPAARAGSGPGPGPGPGSGASAAAALPGNPNRMPSPRGPSGGSGAPEGPPVSGALAARQRRERGAMSAEEQKKQDMLDRRQAVMNNYKPPAEIGGQRVAGVNIDGKGVEDAGGGLLGGMQVQGMVAARHPGGPAAAAPSAGGRQSRTGADSDSESDPEERFEKRVIKPLPANLQGDRHEICANLQGELRELGAAITRDIFTDNPSVRWEDISGLEAAKKLLKEAVVQPIKYPELFTGILAPWKGVLLYGPPGTGKTMLAKAVATECKTTFFNIQASTIISKWRGDSEKLVRVLFELARYHAPSTIFLDEVDALMGARGGEGEHEASRRMKTEILVQMDGLNRSNNMVFVLAATNLPWELDMAMLRRLEKRIYVPLPDTGARLRILQMLLHGRCMRDVSLEQVAAATEGYSGSDVFLVAKEAAMRPLRRLMAQLEAAKSAPKEEEGHGRRAAQRAESINSHHVVPEIGPIEPQDVTSALTVTKASARQYEQKYSKFSEEYGQAGA